jgi:hypothetical protein
MICHKIIITFTLVIFSYASLFGQGCSDAGFCTMGAMRPNQNFGNKSAIKLRSVELLQYVGVTKFHDVILTSLMDINIGIGKKGSFQLKLPYTFVSGSLGNTQGAGDISYAYTHALLVKNTYQLSATLGGKIPTNIADKLSADGRPLPMYYQTSLGTYDIVAGLSFITRNWLLATGYQQALNSNQNEFRWSEWNGSTQLATAMQYPPSWNLKRGKDIMFRIERNFRSTKWNAYVGLLTIYRISKDVISKGTDVTRIEVAGTTGPAITALTGIGYHFSTRVALKGMLGVRLHSRDSNPDGLSREFVSSLSIEIKL